MDLEKAYDIGDCEMMWGILKVYEQMEGYWMECKHSTMILVQVIIKDAGEFQNTKGRSKKV